MKLVRDRIPELIANKGETPVTHIASELEFRKALAEKLLEEAHEFRANPSSEELADVLEVAQALKAFHADADAVRAQKAAEKGRFEKRIMLH